MKFKLSSIFKDVSLTFITEAIVLVGFIFIYRLIANNFGPEGVGKYSLVRRVVGFFYPILLLGLGIGLPRYIAMSRSKEEGRAYIKSGILVVAALTFILLFFINLFKVYFSQIFFGNITYTNLVFPFSFFLLGLILHLLVYSYFRGHLYVKSFNFLQIINLALVPIGILIFFKYISIERLIILIGITTFIIAFIFFLFFIKEILGPIKKWQFKSSLRELLRYSLPRIPGDFGFAGLLSLGPIFAAHFASIQEVGYLVVSQNLLTGICGMVAPLGIILLPKVSYLIAQGEQETIKKNLDLFIAAILQCSIFVCAQLMIFTDSIIRFWLGSEFFGAILVMRIAFISIIFYAFYVVMRSILDAAKVKPLNAINLFISLGVLLLMTAMLLFIFNLFTPIISLSVSSSFGLVCLGTLTYISIRKIYPEGSKMDLNYLWVAIVINILLGGVAILIKPFVVSRFYYLIIFEIVLGAIYLSFLWLLKMEWIRQIPEKVGLKD
jgi:O-antigen/teichoic acid export membrane protein